MPPTTPEPGTPAWYRAMRPNIHTRSEAGFQRTHVWTDDHGAVHGTIYLGATDITFHDSAQVRDLIAHLAILAHQMDDEAAKPEDGAEDDEEPALRVWSPAWGMS